MARENRVFRIRFKDLDKLNSTEGVSNKQIRLVALFLVGNDYDPNEYNRIKLEADFYNDIIMIDTMESYKNLVSINFK